VEIYLATGLRGPDLQLGWLAASLTYSLHALLWAGVVAFMVRGRSVRLALRHTAWKLALLAPLATTSLTLSMPSYERLLGSAANACPIGLFAPGEHREQVELARHAFGVTTTAPSSLLEFLDVALLVAAALGATRFGVVACVQWRRLGPRRPVRNARLLARLARLVDLLALGNVVLTESRNVDCPLVIGRREICVPLATLAALDDAEVDAVLAHELAHLERGDSRWFALLGMVQAALWFHPVTRWVGRQMRQSAELACDERCLELTGEPLALARALTHIAAEALGADRAVALPTMTQPRSLLVARVERLTSGATHVPPQSRGPGHIGLLASLATVTLLCFASSVRVAEAQLASARPSTSRPPAVPSPPARLRADPGAQLADLARQAQGLEAELADLSMRSARLPGGEDPGVRLLEIEQELRHVHQMQAFLEVRALTGE
jgi:beta-lactamase regulating signal transducer with metallopeptidase domain